jgi:hypothetical protein
MGGLGQIEQSAGARLTIPFSETSKLGLSYIQAGQEGGEWEGPDEQLYEKSELMGADLNLMFGKLSLAAEYAQTKAMAVSGGDLDTDNTAMDGKLGYDFGRIQLYGGYREIERNFAAPGSWGKLGRWANPVNIKGPYLNVNSKWGKALTVSSAYESYEPSNTADFGLSDDDELTRQKINVDYAISPTMIFGVGYEQVKWDPTGLDSSKDKYLTLDLSYKMNPDSMLKIGYQIVDYDPGVDGGFYGDDQYKGDIGYVQIGVKF